MADSILHGHFRGFFVLICLSLNVAATENNASYKSLHLRADGLCVYSLRREFCWLKGSDLGAAGIWVIDAWLGCISTVTSKRNWRNSDICQPIAYS